MNQEDIEYELKRIIALIEVELDEMMQISRGYIQNSAEHLLYDLDLERARIDTWELRNIFAGCFRGEYNKINDVIQTQVFQAINQVRQGNTIDKERFKEELLDNVTRQFNKSIRRATEMFSYELKVELRRYQYYIDPNNYHMQESLHIFTTQMPNKAEEIATENKQELTYTLGRMIDNIEFEAKKQKLSQIEKEVERITKETLTLHGNDVSKELLAAKNEIIQYYEELKQLDPQEIENPTIITHFEELKQKWEIINEKTTKEYNTIFKELEDELINAYSNMPFNGELVKQINQILKSEFSLDILQSEIEKYGTVHNMIEQKYISLIERKRQEEQQKNQTLEQKIEQSRHAKIEQPKEEIIEREAMNAEPTAIESPLTDMEIYKAVESLIYSNPELTEEQRDIMLKTLQTEYGVKPEQQEEKRR